MPGITFTPVVPDPESDPNYLNAPLPEITFTPEEIDEQLRGPATVGGIETDLPQVKSVQDMFQGFNSALGDAIAKGMQTEIDAGQAVANLYGWMTGKDIPNNPISARDMLRDYTNEAGLTFDDTPVSELMKDIGEETFQQLLMSGAMIAGAGGMAGFQGGGLVAKDGTLASIIRDMGKWIQANPGATVVSNVGAGVGANLGEEYIGGVPGEMLGGLIGGGAGAPQLAPAVGRAVGGTIGATAGALAGLLGGGPIGAFVGGTGVGAIGLRRGGQLAERVLRSGIEMQGETRALDKALTSKEKLKELIFPNSTGKEYKPVMGRGTVSEASSVAQEIVETEGKRIRDNLDNVYANLSATSGGDVQMEAENLRRSVDMAYKQGQSRAQEYWKLVDESMEAPKSATENIIQTILAENPRTAPENLDRTMDLIERVRGLGKAPEVPPTKAPLPKYGQKLPRAPRKPKPQPVTIKDLRGIQQVIGQRLREDNLGDQQRRYLNMLFKGLDADIAAANPEDQALQNAREFTRWLHENLSRGPLGKFNKAEGTKYSNSLVGDLEAARAMVQQSTSGSQIADVARRLNMPQLETEATNFMRQNLAEAFQSKGPEAAARMMSSPTTQRFMQNFPKAAADLQADNIILQEALKSQKVLDTSAFKAYAGMDPQEAIRHLMGGTQKVKKVEAIKAGLMGNQDALNGFKDGMLAEFYLRTKGSPAQMEDLLKVKDFRGMIASVLGPEDMKRLDRIVKAGKVLEAKGTLSGANTLTSRAFRYLGAGFSRLGGSPTIQESGTAAAIGQTIGAAIMRDIPPETIFTRAIMDPKWERILYSRVPSTLREMLAHQQLVRGVIGSTRALQARSGENDKR